jgi:hypothetical protein
MNAPDSEESPLIAQYAAKYNQQLQILLDRSAPQTLPRWAVWCVSLLVYVLRVFFLRGFYIVTYGLGIYNLNLLLGFITPQVDPELQHEEGPALPTKSDQEFKPFIRRLPEFKFWCVVCFCLCVCACVQCREQQRQQPGQEPQCVHLAAAGATAVGAHAAGAAQAEQHLGAAGTCVRVRADWRLHACDCAALLLSCRRWSSVKSLWIGLGMTLFPMFDVPVFWPILLMYWLLLFTVTMKRQIKHMIKYRYLPFSTGKKVRAAPARRRAQRAVAGSSRQEEAAMHATAAAGSSAAAQLSCTCCAAQALVWPRA